LELAKKIRDFHLIYDELIKVDVIIVLCSNDIRVAEYSADLMIKWYAKYIIFSWGIAHNNDILVTWRNKSEAEIFKDIVIDKWFAENKILLDTKAKNTWENIINSYKILKKENINHWKIMLIQKPFMQKRTYATFMKQRPWKDKNFIISAPNISFENYPTKILTIDNIIHTMVWDLQRIIEYPKLWFQIKQNIPINIYKAYIKLIKLWYTKHMINKLN